MYNTERRRVILSMSKATLIVQIQAVLEETEIRNQYWLDLFAANFLALILKKKKNLPLTFFLIYVTAFELQNKNFLYIIILLACVYFNARQMGQIISYS